ncbi:hypothetical protein CEXT_80271 [Caerostris extrusa]|uniref:Uncharacterized protein n=1 Tax=Caerostris extrusa TaxID=172846 RepID=A0AAV4W223_CAEEX|nr:hypothetical protein CEXT_80271 [Caerostris extrusa]
MAAKRADYTHKQSLPYTINEHCITVRIVCSERSCLIGQERKAERNAVLVNNTVETAHEQTILNVNISYLTPAKRKWFENCKQKEAIVVT